MKEAFNESWTFLKRHVDASYESVIQEKEKFVPVEIPHDWLIGDTSSFYEDASGWYRKCFDFHQEDEEKIYLYFDGIYMESTIFLNGQEIGGWNYGYTSFEVECSQYIRQGENELIVVARYRNPNSRWYSGAGIYRHVWMVRRPTTYIEADGIYTSVRRVDESNWALEIEISLYGKGKILVTEELWNHKLCLAKSSEELIFPKIYDEETKSYILSQKMVYRQELSIKDPLLWSPKTPNLYQLVTRIERIDKDFAPIATKTDQEERQEILGEERMNIGFRKIELSAKEGFFINGVHDKIKGVCEHHDIGCLGAAFNLVAQRRRFEILKSMGVNTIRISHNMPDPQVMDLADEMGFFIINEAFDMWKHPKTKYDYARFFERDAKRDVKNWIIRDRNHPSLIFWSIGNEIYDTHAGPEGKEMMETLIEWVKTYDPKENGKVTFASNYMPWENTQLCAERIKLVGYNYGAKFYEEHHKQHLDWIIYGSETGSLVQSRGIYHFPLETSILAEDDFQCSALGNSPTSWGAKSYQDCLQAERDAPYSLGQCIWSGFDYIGEPTPYHTKNSYFGQIDTAGFPKDSYYVYKAEWQDIEKGYVLHLYPYWNYNEGQLIDVCACTNACKLALLLNGQKISDQRKDNPKHEAWIASWKIPYTYGEIKAIAYDELNQVIAEETRHSFGEAAEIDLSVESYELSLDKEDLGFVTVSMLDKDGYKVENATNRMIVTVGGSGTLLGIDNGDSTDRESYQSPSRRLFSGKLLIVVKASHKPGMIKVKVESPGIPSQEIQMRVEKKDDHQQLKKTQNQEIKESKESQEAQAIQEIHNSRVIQEEWLNDRPVRQIALSCEEEKRLTRENQEISVHAEILPKNASDQKLEWRITDNNGIDSPLAEIESMEDGHHIRLKALGDGIFQLRCMSRSSGKDIRCMSSLSFVNEGLGQLYKNPYSFISGGLYDGFEGDIGMGNERGVSMAREGKSCVIYKDLDFGQVGSDTMLIPIFALSSEEYPIEIWENKPSEPDSHCLLKTIYQKPSKWNVYQEESFKLDKCLKGICTLAIVTYQKMHIKGFVFKEKMKAYERLSSLDSDFLYGDHYKKEDWGISQIGNNVTLIFENMDFGRDDQVVKLYFRMKGRAIDHKNTISLKVEADTGEFLKSIDIEPSFERIEQNVEVDAIRGNARVSLIFLPGSCFDLEWIQFEKNV